MQVLDVVISCHAHLVVMCSMMEGLFSYSDQIFYLPKVNTE